MSDQEKRDEKAGTPATSAASGGKAKDDPAGSPTAPPKGDGTGETITGTPPKGSGGGKPAG